MKSHTRPSFRRLFDALPRDIQAEAVKAYKTWRDDPSYPGLQFKQVKPTTPPLYSVRITRNWRALGYLEGDTVVWVWIGPHDEYMRLIK